MDLLWTGTDCLFMHKYPGGLYNIKVFIMRLLVKILDRWFIERNYVIAEHLKEELKLRKPVFTYTPPMELKVYPKIKHEGFNILYYCPKTNNQKFTNWLYGYDRFLKYKEVTNYNFIVVDGSQDMSKIYPIVDFYYRPNRHDGSPYMIRECEYNNIPYYWSKGAYDNYKNK